MNPLVTMLIAMMLAGCAVAQTTTPRGLVLDPVGPPPAATRNADTASKGNLHVFTAPAGYRHLYAHYYPRTDFAIYTAQGKILRRPHLIATVHDETPALVRLPVGSYKIVVKSDRYRSVTVPVVIKPEQTTFVHLDGDATLQPAASEKQFYVLLPSGQIVGWRAGTASAIGW
jgi:hypothetical protein